MPPLPDKLFEKLNTEYKLSDYNAELLTAEKSTALFYLKLIEQTPHFKSAANLIINKINPFLSGKNIQLNDLPIPIEKLTEFIQLIEDGKISRSIAYQRLFPAMFNQPGKEALALAQELNLLQNKDEGFLEKIIDEVLSKNPDKVKAYKNGKKGLIGFFMGQVMRASGGKAEPKTAKVLVEEKLKN